MNYIDIEKYKNAWKNEQGFDNQKLSEDEITKFMHSSSKSLLGMFKKSLVFDIVFKATIFISLLLLFILFPNLNGLIYINIIVLVFLLSGVYFQFTILKKIPSNIQHHLNISDKLHEYIAFYYKYFVSSIYVAASSAVLLFYPGSVYYLLFKYQKIPVFQTDDFIVMAIGIILSYGISFYAQLQQNIFRIHQLEKSLNEIEEDVFGEKEFKAIQRKRIRNIIVISGLLILGILFLIFLISR